MAGVRFRTEFTSDRGNEYQCDIYDTDYVGSVNAFKCNSFSLSYKDEGDERTVPIKGSEVKLPCEVNNATFETLISDMVNSKEQRFYLLIYKNSSLYWVGLVLQDLSEKQDISMPYTFEISATDGLGRLKDFDFPLANNTALAVSFIEILYSIFQYTPLYERIGSSDPMLGTSVFWYENQMYSGTPGAALDPLARSYTDPRLFVDNENRALSCLEVLEIILHQWHCRIFLDDGMFRIIQLPADKDATYSHRIYDKDSSVNGSSPVTLSNRVSIDQVTQYRMAGAVVQYFPPLRSVIATYNVDNQNILPVATSYSSGVSIGDILNTTSDKLRIWGGFTFKATFDTSDTRSYNAQKSARYKLTLTAKSGGTTYYLTNSGGSASWVTSSAYYMLQFYAAGSKQTLLGNNFNFDITTPALPAGDLEALNFKFEPLDMVDVLFGAQIINILTNTVSNEKFQISFVNEDQQDQNGVRYVVNNTNAQINSISDETDVLFGDGPSNVSIGSVLVLDTSDALQPSTGQWKLNGSGTALGLISLMCREILSGQKRPVPKYNMTIYGDITPLSALVLDSSVYVFNGVELDARLDQWAGEWFELYRDIDLLDFGPTTVNQGVPASVLPPVAGKWTGAVDFQLNDLLQKQMMMMRFFSLTDLFALPAGTTTTINITPIGSLAVKKGDKLTLVDTGNNEMVNVVVDADVNTSDTTITIVSQSFSKSIDQGFVMFSKGTLVAETARFTNLPTSTTGQPIGQIYRSVDTLKQVN